MKLCKDCKHSREVTGIHLAGVTHYASCYAPENMQPNFYGGGQMQISFTVQSTRIDRSMCGPDAKWYEPKESKA